MGEQLAVMNRKGKGEMDNREVGYSALVLQVCIGNVQEYRKLLRKWEFNSLLLGRSDNLIELKMIENLLFFIDGSYTNLMGVLLPSTQERDKGDYIFHKLYKEWKEVQKRLGTDYIVEESPLFDKYLKENYG